MYVTVSIIFIQFDILSFAISYVVTLVWPPKRLRNRIVARGRKRLCTTGLTHSKGVDDIDPCIATPCIASVAWPLSEIINCYFKTGIVPNALKIAKVVPIFKKGERDNITNYRPISILPYFNKFFEKIMYDRLYNYVDKFKIIFHNQHA